MVAECNHKTKWAGGASHTPARGPKPLEKDQATSISTLPLSAQQAGPAIYAKSQTVRKGTLVPQGHVARWLKRPTPRPMGWCDAELVIDGTPYRAEATFTLDGDTGASFLIVDLRRYNGTHYRLILGQGSEQCDCPHSTYRGDNVEGFRCKHVAAVVEALDQLDAIERAEWEMELASAALDVALAVEPPPF